jgi:hypothetical protein
MTVDFQTLLALRDERRAAASDERVDAIVITELKAELVTALRKATEKLNRIDCDKRPALAARVAAELQWIEVATRVFGAPDA